MNKFYKGRTNNHLTWVMVDATDFATPESALSAAMKIKIYGKLRGATGVNFVSSGTGSLTNDIQHVGASVLGIYTIALAKADLSDASAAWYDQYVVSLSATGAAYQALVVDGGIDDSEVLSQLLIALSAASDAHSAAAQANSRVLLVQSRLSDFQSVYVSDMSDVKSLLSNINSLAGSSPTASDIASAVNVELGSRLSDILSAAVQTNSRVILIQSRLSDFNSVYTSDISDLKSAIAGITVSLDASNISDIASAVVAALPITSLVSDAHSAAAQANSRVLVVLSRLSDFDSRLVSDVSDLASQLTVIQSMASDAASAATQANSRVLLNQSRISDVQSYLVALSGMLSDTHSAATAGSSRALVAQSGVSDIYSLLSDLHSDVGVMSGIQSDVLSAATAIKAKTDGLTFTVANVVDANLQRINDVVVNGDGAATPWGP
jgi:hypothetical protein